MLNINFTIQYYNKNMSLTIVFQNIFLSAVAIKLLFIKILINRNTVRTNWTILVLKKL